MITVPSNQEPEMLVFLWILSLIIKKPYCFSIPEYTVVVSTSVRETICMEAVFLIFQGDPGLQGPPGMRGRNGDDVSDIDAQYNGCRR